MPRNEIQFQKGFSLPCFLEQFGTQEKCEKQLFRFRWPEGFVCPKCGHRDYFTLKSRALFQCCRCRHQCSLTSGTIFASSKLPLTIWFLAIYLITQSKEGMSSLHLSRFLGISYNAGLRMKHKLQHVMKITDDTLPLTNFIQIDDAYWGGKSHGGKRGRGAPGKTPFVAAVATNDEGHPIHMRLSRIKSFSSKEICRWAKKHLHHDAIVFSDGLACFNAVKTTGCWHEPIVTGGGWQSMAIPEFKWVNVMLGNIKNALHGTYHHVSKKHLPRYLAEFCFRFNHRFNLSNMVDALVRATVLTKPIPQHKLKRAEKWW